MKAAIFGKDFQISFGSSLESFFEKLQSRGVEIVIYKPFFDLISEKEILFRGNPTFFDTFQNLPSDVDIFFSIGGDGTFLESVSLVRNSGIPIVGINSGRLGFLANISAETMSKSLNDILSGNYSIEKRTLIRLKSKEFSKTEWTYGFNEITVQKRDTGSMIVVHLYLEGKLLNSYRADGLIVSTPSGSTAYSLSVGGPIIAPESGNFVITPIAPHTLTVRPIIVPDNVHLKLIIESRNTTYLASIDSRSYILDTSVELELEKARFRISMIKTPESDYFETLRTKLMWGLDKRN